MAGVSGCGPDYGLWLLMEALRQEEAGGSGAFVIEDLEGGSCNVTASGPLTQEDLFSLERLHEERPIKTLLACDPNLTIEETEALLNRFEGLEGFGNRAAHLASLDELSNYFQLFETELDRGRPVLRALHIQAELGLSELEPILSHLSTLYHLFIDSDNMESVDLSDCASLETVDLPQAREVDLLNCTRLKTVDLPQAKEVNLCGCISCAELTKEQLPLVKKLRLSTISGGGLPSGIEQLRTLKRLDLLDMGLTGLPEELLSLPSTCTIDLTFTGISSEVLRRLGERCVEAGYNGPRISYSVAIVEQRREGELSIEESLEGLCKLAGGGPLTLKNIPNEVVKEDNLRAWLNRLSYMADYNCTGERQAQLAQNILGYLQPADESEEYRASFGLSIAQAIGTCGDRMAYYLLFLDLDARLITMDLKDTPALGDFLLKGYWQMHLLEECARATVKELIFFDEIEVYLGYPVKLKERLQIPINIKKMLFFACSALNERHLDAAVQHVEEQFKNEDARLNFLIERPEWVKALELVFPEKLTALKEVRDAEEEDYVKAYEDYKQGLRELTKQAL